jgi:uncharacterized membrane protein
MAQIEKSVEVEVPVRTAYNQWTQFEEFPRFMEGVKSVRQLDDRHLEWTATVAGREKQWQAEIREQRPDEIIVWHSTDGSENAGIVRFDPIDMNRTKVTLMMSYDPEGMVEAAGDALGFMSRRVGGDLDRFRDFIEERGVESGAYRETLENPKAPGGHTRGAPAN